MNDDHLTIYGPIKLGALIDRLAKCDPEREVMYDMLGLGPTSFDSYRGYYDHLALGYKDDHKIRAGELLELARAALGAEFTGWKGGDYSIVDVDSGGDDGWRVTIKVARCET